MSQSGRYPYHRILWHGQPIARATTCKAAAAKVLAMVDAGRGTWGDYRIVYTPTTRQREIARWQVADLMRRGGAANLERAIATAQWLREVSA